MKFKKTLSMILALTVASSSLSVSAASLQTEVSQDLTTVSTEAPAEKNYVYGTMQIPYAAFYAAELNENNTAVDAVTSATASKWQKQAGTYYEAATEGAGGTILGVKYFVAIENDVYEELQKNNSALLATFSKTEEVPATYKVMDANGNFSAVQGNTTKLENVTYTFATTSTWGDYQINFTGLELDGTVYGVILETTDGAKYGLRHLENIWKNATQLSWSSGIKTVEAKGNTLSYELNNYSKKWQNHFKDHF